MYTTKAGEVGIPDFSQNTPMKPPEQGRKIRDGKP